MHVSIIYYLKRFAKTILSFAANYKNLPNEVFLNMSSKDSLKLTDIVLFLSKHFNKEFPKIVYDKQLSSFLIDNNRNCDLINNSSLLDMIKNNLVDE